MDNKEKVDMSDDPIEVNQRTIIPMRDLIGKLVLFHAANPTIYNSPKSQKGVIKSIRKGKESNPHEDFGVEYRNGEEGVWVVIFDPITNMSYERNIENVVIIG